MKCRKPFNIIVIFRRHLICKFTQNRLIGAFGDISWTKIRWRDWSN